MRRLSQSSQKMPCKQFTVLKLWSLVVCARFTVASVACLCRVRVWQLVPALSLRVCQLKVNWAGPGSLAVCAPGMVASAARVSVHAKQMGLYHDPWMHSASDCDTAPFACMDRNRLGTSHQTLDPMRSIILH